MVAVLWSTLLSPLQSHAHSLLTLTSVAQEARPGHVLTKAIWNGLTTINKDTVTINEGGDAEQIPTHNPT